MLVLRYDKLALKVELATKLVADTYVCIEVI